MGKIKQFCITCISCDFHNQKHSTNLYIDWEAKSYAIICETCGLAEYFDRKGESQRVEYLGTDKPIPGKKIDPFRKPINGDKKKEEVN